ncbi:unnamed protein product, partial [Bubo scandiacus]
TLCLVLGEQLSCLVLGEQSSSTCVQIPFNTVVSQLCLRQADDAPRLTRPCPRGTEV